MCFSLTHIYIYIYNINNASNLSCLAHFLLKSDFILYRVLSTYIKIIYEVFGTKFN